MWYRGLIITFAFGFFVGGCSPDTLNIPLLTSGQEADLGDAGEPSPVLTPKTVKSEPKKALKRLGSAPAAVGVSGPSEAVSASKKGGNIHLDFDRAEISSVVAALLGDVLRLPFTVDPAVVGTVTMRAPSGLPVAKVLPALREVLRVHGAALVKRDGVYHVIPAEAMGPAQLGGSGVGVAVIPLRHVALTDIRTVLEDVAPFDGAVRFSEGANLVVVVGTPAERRSFADLVRVLDRDELAGLSVAMITLQRARASDVVTELQDVFGFAVKRTDRIRFMAVERLNAVIVLAKVKSDLDEALGWLEQLDGDDHGGERIYVYRVQHRRADVLAEVLGNLLEDFAGTSEDGEPAGLKFVSDDARNLLITRATPAAYEMVTATLSTLDVEAVQVAIEVTIAEVTLNDDLQYGVRWAFENGTLGSISVGDVAAETLTGGFSYLFSGSRGRVALSALVERTDVRVLSSPTVMVLDNQRARLQVGDEVPVLTRLAQSSGDPDAPIVTEVARRQTGVILEVRPLVQAGGVVRMEVRQEVSAAFPAGAGGGDVAIQQREVESVVVVGSGETLVLGGLIRDVKEVGNEGIPVLSDLPFVGALFGERRKNATRTELLILITPRIIQGATAAQEVTNALRKRFAAIYGDRKDG